MFFTVSPNDGIHYYEENDMLFKSVFNNDETPIQMLSESIISWGEPNIILLSSQHINFVERSLSTLF